MAWILLADSQPLFNEALATVHRFRPELVLVDATIGLDGSPTVVTRILEAHPEAKVIVLGEDRDVDLLLAAVRAGAAGAVGKTCGATTIPRSVRTHIQNILGKLGMHSTLEAATFAMQCRLEPVAGGAIKLG